MRILHIALFLLINVGQTEDSVRVLHGGPNVYIAINAAGGKILVTQIRSQTQRHNLNDLVVVRFHHHIILIALFKAHDKEVAVPHGTNEQVMLFTSDTHMNQGCVRFVRVTAALQFVVPHFHRLVVGTRHELRFTNFSQVRNVAFVGPLVLERFLHHYHII